MKSPVKFMTLSLKLLLSGLFAAALLTSCSKDDEPAKKKDIEPIRNSLMEHIFASPEATLSVVDMDGKPIAGAKILVGSSVGQPFAENYLSTDSNGVFIAPEAWKDAEMVTVVAPSFVTTTYLEQTPHGQSFQLHASDSGTKYELTGQGTGFQTIDSDNTIDYALMAPMLDRQSLLSFDLNMLLNTKMDKITIYGQDMLIPSNVALPKQKEHYGIFPVTLEKPIYHMYFPSLGAHRVMTIHGQFPFKQVVKELQDKKQFVDLINYFTMLGGSIHDVQITGSTQNQNLPIAELSFNQTATFHAPALGSGTTLIAVALSPYQGQFLLTDVKNVASNATIKMTTASGATPSLLTVMQNQADNQQMTSALAPFAQATTANMLPLLSHPQIININDIKISTVTAPTGLTPLATYAVLSSIIGIAADGSELTSKNWEVYSPNWESEIKLPQLPNMTFVASPQKRWEVSLMASDSGIRQTGLGPRILETATHSTHSATDF